MTDWNRAARAAEIMNLRLAQLADGDHPETDADRLDVARWSQILVTATERYGNHALDLAKATAAASAHVKMRMRTDAELRPDDDPADRAVKAHEAGLKLFLAYLAGDRPLPEPDPIRPVVITVYDRTGQPLSVELYCDQCAETVKARETAKGHRWPKPWEQAADTVHEDGCLTRIHESREPIGRCVNCQPVEI